MPPPLPTVFVIRIWTETSTVGGSLRRGYVEYIATGERRYFAELSEALEFVSAISTMHLHPGS